MKQVGLVAVFVMMASIASAQVLTPKAAWTTADSVADASSFTYVLKNGSSVVPTGQVSCSLVNTQTSCVLPITGPLAPGTYTLTVSNLFGSVTSAPVEGKAPGPITFSFSFTVTIP